MNAVKFKPSMLLHAAKHELSWLNPMGLCQAIGIAAHKMGCIGAVLAANEFEAEIEERLYPFAYAHSWLGWRMTYPQYKAKDNEKWPRRVWDKAYNWGNDCKEYNPQALQAWRHAWLDKLIAEYERKEKRNEQK